MNETLLIIQAQLTHLIALPFQPGRLTIVTVGGGGGDMRVSRREPGVDMVCMELWVCMTV